MQSFVLTQTNTNLCPGLLAWDFFSRRILFRMALIGETQFYQCSALEHESRKLEANHEKASVVVKVIPLQSHGTAAFLSTKISTAEHC